MVHVILSAGKSVGFKSFHFSFGATVVKAAWHLFLKGWFFRSEFKITG